MNQVYNVGDVVKIRYNLNDIDREISSRHRFTPNVITEMVQKEGETATINRRWEIAHGCYCYEVKGSICTWISEYFEPVNNIIEIVSDKDIELFLQD